MAEPKTKQQAGLHNDSFDVTLEQKVGTVFIDGDAYGAARTAWEAAWLMVAAHDLDGKYSFQIPGSPRVHLTVETEDQP